MDAIFDSEPIQQELFMEDLEEETQWAPNLMRVR
jgi:hypothetical protein